MVWSPIVARCNTNWSEALEAAASGSRLQAEQAAALFGAPLAALGTAADAVCRRLHPQPARTFVIDRNINYSNVCISGCRFCAFFRPPGHPDGYLLTHDQILDKVAEAVGLGATQILMQGGLHPELPLSWFEEVFRLLKTRFPAVVLHSLSAPEIVHLARQSGLTPRETMRRLQAAGLDSLPGGGAEILCDEVRALLSPRKCTTEEWLSVMRDAHALGMRATATMVFGHVETLKQRVEHLLRVRELQDETGLFTAFIPWTFQPANTALGGQAAGAHDYLRTLAVSRLVLDNVPNLQASWVTQGAKLAQLSLAFGANDLGSTMIEENVVRAAGVSFRLSAQQLAELIRGAGFTPTRRDTYYRLLEEA
jgi:cyclic dehypoxanthinyl futalosine synthase